ncbi:AraC family transcriptional regulator [Crassaminicella thermophila]|uniref:AraC family transcriptional regulator n=1 Tax=Crassaminicella thermophila TaxID=2599308 RepID=A0A5C0SDY1_CRATE|nr:DRTGG domain-containing protein [Crassaminicella thermophila]QEK12320.1 AraC family transcriptional regulator [Crassaminicella thermophila]
MKVNDLIKKENFKLLTDNQTISKEIKGVYCCDLLSWVMANAKAGDAWITVQTHMNIVAVASLLEISCIIIPESIDVDMDTINKANEENIPIISTDLNSYGIFCILHDLGL